MAKSQPNKLVTGVEEVQKLLDGVAEPFIKKAGLAETAALLEKLKTTPETDDDKDVMYVFDMNGNKVLL